MVMIITKRRPMSEIRDIIKRFLEDADIVFSNQEMPKAIQELKDRTIDGRDKNKLLEQERRKTIDEIEPRINMGLSDIMCATFPRVFRFTIHSKTIPQIHPYAMSFKPDFTKQKLDFEMLEVMGDDEIIQKIHAFSKTPKSDEEITLVTYDGCGTPLYKMIFSGVTALSHKMNGFDYSKSHTCNHIFKLRFEDYEYKSLLKPKGEKDDTNIAN